MINEVFMHSPVNDTYTKIAIFNYTGSGDPVIHIDTAIEQYTSGFKRYEYNEFVDMNMDNPWVRIITIPLEKDEMRDQKLKLLNDDTI